MPTYFALGFSPRRKQEEQKEQKQERGEGEQQNDETKEVAHYGAGG